MTGAFEISGQIFEVRKCPAITFNEKEHKEALNNYNRLHLFANNGT